MRVPYDAELFYPPFWDDMTYLIWTDDGGVASKYHVAQFWHFLKDKVPTVEWRLDQDGRAMVMWREHYECHAFIEGIRHRSFKVTHWGHKVLLFAKA